MGDKVTTDNLKIITLCLRHRLRKDPLESIDSDKVSKFQRSFEIEDYNIFNNYFSFSYKINRNIFIFSVNRLNIC
jgi:hypothetical protein